MSGSNLSLISFPNFAQFSRRIRGAVTTRAGGVSPAPFDSLNLGFKTGDDRGNVLINRRRALSFFRTGEASDDYPLNDWVGLEQVHGVHCVLVTKGHSGMGALSSTVGDEGGPVAQGDAMLTNSPGIVLAISVADCVPVLLYDSENNALGVAHCGWKPAAAGILENLFAAMNTAFGTTPKDVYAGIGPGISADKYEVGGEVARNFEKDLYSGYRVVWPGRIDESGGEQKYQLNLWAALNAQLDNCGVPKHQISTIVKCTYKNESLFYSYRRDGAKTGRMMLLAELIP